MKYYYLFFFFICCLYIFQTLLNSFKNTCKLKANYEPGTVLNT